MSGQPSACFINRLANRQIAAVHLAFGLTLAYCNGVGPVGRLHRRLNRKPGEQRFSRQVRSKKTNGTAFAERADNEFTSSYRKAGDRRWPFALLSWFRAGECVQRN